MSKGFPSYSTKAAVKIARLLVFEDDAGLRGHNTVRMAVEKTLPFVGISGQYAAEPEMPDKKAEFERGVVAGGGTVDADAAQTYTPLAANGTSANPVSVRHHDEGEPCGLVIGATVLPGALLTADTDGRGVTAVAGEYYGARALQGGVIGEQIDVVPVFGQLDSDT